ncbi:MAG: DoxX-like family protein [Flavobacterium sp.]
MNQVKIQKILNICFALVWLVNGLFCKVLNLVPRHEQIVARILGEQYSRELIILIGLSEIVMAIWIFSNYKKRLNTIIQIAVVLTMNILEFLLVPDLLLWGKLNLVFACLFLLLVYYKEFHLNLKKPV